VSNEKGMTPEFSKELQRFMRSNSYLDYEEDVFGESGYVSFATRENGSVGDEEPGEEDLAEAERIQRLLLDRYNDIDVEIGVADEWVDICIRRK